MTKHGKILSGIRKRNMTRTQFGPSCISHLRGDIIDHTSAITVKIPPKLFSFVM
jgi:hypothetical protein